MLPVTLAKHPAASQSSMTEVWGTVYARRFGSNYGVDSLAEVQVLTC